MGNEHEDDDSPVTPRQLLVMLAFGLASWAVVALLFYGAMKLAEVMR